MLGRDALATWEATCEAVLEMLGRDALEGRNGYFTLTGGASPSQTETPTLDKGIQIVNFLLPPLITTPLDFIFLGPVRFFIGALWNLLSIPTQVAGLAGLGVFLAALLITFRLLLDIFGLLPELANLFGPLVVVHANRREVRERG